MKPALVFLLLSTCASAEELWPIPDWPRARPAQVGMDEARLRPAREYALTGGGSGYVTRHGKLVMSWGDPAQLYDLKSTTKSIGVTALGLALLDGKMKLDDKAAKHHPTLGVPPESNKKTGWLDQITLLHLATQTAGFEKPGGYEPLLFRPGTKWHYSDGGPNWLAECVTLVYRRDLQDLLFERVFSPLGIERSDLTWRNNAYRPREIDGIPRREFGSGVSANVDAMARIGYLYLRGGRWQHKQILPQEFVDTARTTLPAVVGVPILDPEKYGNASDHYGLLWWNNRDGTIPTVPRDAYWSWGLYDSLIVVVPSLDIVVARAGKSWKRNGGGHYDVLKPFLGPLVASLRIGPETSWGLSRFSHSENRTVPLRNAEVVLRLPLRIEKTISGARFHRARHVGNAPHGHVPTVVCCAILNESPADTEAPYPPSEVIQEIVWAPAATIVRKAAGSDNWPITWGDDDAQYTAYGDGWGFDPKVPEKLSLGLARIVGPANNFKGVNLRSPTAEQRGDGASGKKASGMLMVEGVLYMWARNAGVSQLAWSKDHGRTWTWSPWRFAAGLGCPTFLNFGPDYRGARDPFVYTFSPDADNAYGPADRMVLARAAKDRITEREAYEFFVRLDHAGRPIWTGDIARRGAVFLDPGRCARSSITYNAPLKRYLWVQVLPGEKPRERTGLAIYDAPEPWGPWTTAYFAEEWDVSPGETAGFPARWISDDGKTLDLVFSGDDSFSVRKATLVLGGHSE